jgi:hypothetical protein
MEKLSKEYATNNFYECYRRWEVIIKKYEEMEARRYIGSPVQPIDTIETQETDRLAKEWFDAQVELAKAKKQYDEAYH